MVREKDRARFGLSTEQSLVPMGCLPPGTVGKKSEAALEFGPPEGNTTVLQSFDDHRMRKSVMIVGAEGDESQFRRDLVQQLLGQTFSAAVVGQFEQID